MTDPSIYQLLSVLPLFSSTRDFIGMEIRDYANDERPIDRFTILYYFSCSLQIQLHWDQVFQTDLFLWKRRRATCVNTN